MGINFFPLNKWSENFRSNQIRSCSENEIWSDLTSLFCQMILIWSQITIFVICPNSAVWFVLPCSIPLCRICTIQGVRYYHTWNLCSHVPPFPCFSLRLDFFFVATHFEISRLFTGSSLGTDFKIWLAKLIILLSSWRLSSIGKSANTQLIFEFKVSMWPTGPLALKPKEIWNN